VAAVIAIHGPIFSCGWMSEQLQGSSLPAFAHHFTVLYLHLQQFKPCGTCHGTRTLTVEYS